MGCGKLVEKNENIKQKKLDTIEIFQTYEILNHDSVNS